MKTEDHPILYFLLNANVTVEEIGQMVIAPIWTLISLDHIIRAKRRGTQAGKSCKMILILVRYPMPVKDVSVFLNQDLDLTISCS